MDDDGEQAFDVVVVGAGTGLFAAIAAAERGLKVLLVEKTGFFGGSAAMSAGIVWMPGNAVAQEAGTGDNRQRADAYVDTLVGDTGQRERWMSFLDHAPAAAELLGSATPCTFMHVPNYPDHHSHLRGASVSGRSIEPKPLDISFLGDDAARIRPSNVKAPVPMPITSVDYKWLVLLARVPWQGVPRAIWRLAQGIGGRAAGRRHVAAGQALVGGLIAGARRAGVEMWPESPLRDLVTDGARVTGVVVEHQGRIRRVMVPRGVILAAGGFENNKEMRRRYQSDMLQDGWSFGACANTGDVITIAERHGAALGLMDQSWWSPGIPPTKRGDAPSFLLAERSLPGVIIVDATGKRFFNESCDHMSAGHAMLGRGDVARNHLPAWLVFDQKYRNSFVFAGRLLPGMPLPRSWYRSGVAHKGRTVAELAQKLGMPGLRDGVARFNILAAQGHDDDFGRGETAHDRYWGDPTNAPNPNLRALTKGPFHAVQVVPGDFGTCGGIMADGQARALRADGSVIDGLYAVGNCAANAFGDTSPHLGATLGQGLTFGWVAAQHAAEQHGGEIEQSPPGTAESD